MRTPYKKLIEKVREEMDTQGFSILPTVDLLPTCLLFKTPGKYKKVPAELVEYLDYMKKLAAALRLQIEYIDFRCEKKPPSKRSKNNGSSWHPDGPFIRSICCFHGKQTLIKHKGKVFSLKRGQTLLLTGAKREEETKIPATIHKRPDVFKKTRNIIVASFVPKNQPQDLNLQAV